MTELVETIYHWHAGQGLRTIVKSLGISRNTVRKYVRLAKQAGLRRGEPLPSRERLVDILYIPGPQPASSGPATSQLSPFHAQLEAWFKEKDMTAKQAWRLLREEHGLQVGYTTVKSYVRTHIRKMVLPGFPWVLRSSVSGIEVQAAAEETDGGFEVLSVAVPAGPALDGHDLAVEAFG